MSTAEEQESRAQSPAAAATEIPETNGANEDVEMKDHQSSAETPPVIVDYAEESRKIEEKARYYLARQTKPVIIPQFAQWFDLEAIHEIEKKSLPEYFNNNSRFKTDKIYKDIRNFMINTYRLNPSEYLTVTATRRNIAADVASIIRIHGFLEQWGLINYQIDPKTRPSLSGPQYTGHFQIVLDTPEGLKPFIPEDAKIINADTTTTTTTTTTTNDESKTLDIPLNLNLRRNIYDSTQDALALNEQERLNSSLNTKQFTCYVTGNDATEVRYYNLKSKNTISARAFKEGHFGANFQASDFVRLESIQKQSEGQPWTNQEVLLLLEGVEMFDNDWEKIANHIGSRSSEQAISKFIQLPIEDGYIVENSKKSTGKDETIKESSNTNDAVLRTIKFLISNVNPELASKNFLEKDEDVQKAIKTTIGSILGTSQVEQDSIKKESNELIKNLVSLEISKLDAKLSKLSILEKQLNKERAELSNQRKELILDRLTLKKQAINVRNKLIEASTAESPEDGIKLSQEALTIAKKAPRVSIIQVQQTQEQNNIEQEENGEEKVKEEVVPISLETPETYQFWKL